MAERALLAAVAPGGVLLLVHHAEMDTQQAHDGGFDPADCVWPPMVVALLNDDWELEPDEQRPRIAPTTGLRSSPVMGCRTSAAFAVELGHFSGRKQAGPSSRPASTPGLPWGWA